MYSDAWAVRGCRLSRKVVGATPKQNHYDVAKQYSTVLIFAAGPNANPTAGRKASSCSCKRTFSQAAHDSYDVFKQGVAAAVRTSLALAAGQCDVVLLARFSGGLYAGPHRDRIHADFVPLVRGVLQEPVGPAGQVCGSYFQRVVLVDLPAAAAGSASGSKRPAAGVAGAPGGSKRRKEQAPARASAQRGAGAKRPASAGASTDPKRQS